MISNDILPEIMSCKDVNDNFIVSKVIEYRSLLYSLLDGLTMRIDKTIISYQDIDLLYIDYYERRWGELPVVEDFIKMLVIADVIRLNSDKTMFKILIHDPQHILKHANKLRELIGEDKYQEVLKLPLPDLILYLNSNDAIKNAYNIDKQIWLGD